MFPRVDPIPLPAPVWVFKGLELLTITLHFLAVRLLVGGLAAAAVWAFWGRRRRDPAMLEASAAAARQLPIVMTYVINLGVPPLLFAQVLYGRALYTSSILIGAYWISVIFLLMIAYTLLYVMAGRAAAGRSGWAAASGGAALLVILAIAMIYSSNMTLMLRPERWAAMYQADPVGLHLNHGDPTVGPRWLLMMVGGLTVGGVGLMLLSWLKGLSPGARSLARRHGALLALAGVVLESLAAAGALASQPDGVRAALWDRPFYAACAAGWCAAALATAVCAAAACRRAEARWPVWGAAAAVGAATALLAVIRGGVRDVTLLARGLDVWDRQVQANWLVVGGFLAALVLALAAVGWLICVAARAGERSASYG